MNIPRVLTGQAPVFAGIAFALMTTLSAFVNAPCRDSCPADESHWLGFAPCWDVMYDCDASPGSCEFDDPDCRYVHPCVFDTFLSITRIAGPGCTVSFPLEWDHQSGSVSGTGNYSGGAWSVFQLSDPFVIDGDLVHNCSVGAVNAFYDASASIITITTKCYKCDDVLP